MRSILPGNLVQGDWRNTLHRRCTSETHKIWVHHRLISNFDIKDKGSIRKPSEVKASVNLNQSLFKLGEGQILMSAENHD